MKSVTVDPFVKVQQYNPFVKNPTVYHIGLKPTIAVEDGKIWLYRARHDSKGSRESVMS